MTAALRSALATQWAGIRQRLAPTQASADSRGVLCISVSELGWRATLLHADESPHESAEALAGANPVESLRRAIRAVPRSQRDRIGSIRLLVSDPAACLVDNRSSRIRSADPVIVRQSGAQELGVKTALYAFRPFGRSSENEVERGAYAFLPAERVQDYLGALETFALKLVELVPAPLLELPGPDSAASAWLDVRLDASTFVLADPETGNVLCREIACGTNSFAAALADATSVSVREAAEGLQRRACFRADAGGEGARAALTATDRALAPVLGRLRAELTASLEHFLYQRLATAPERLVLYGECDRVRGLRDWLGNVTRLEPEQGRSAHERFLAAQVRPSLNLLESVPSGLLRIGKTEYRFVGGRFQPDQAQPPRAASQPRRRGHVSLPSLRGRWAAPLPAQAVTAAACAATLAGALWLSAGGLDSPLDHATRALSAALAEDAVLRAALIRRASPAQRPEQPVLFWFDKLDAIAGSVPDGLRLTRITTAGSQTGRDEQILLEGEAVADDERLARITEFIERLSSNRAFMHDVTAITFGGAEMGEGQAREFAQFKVTVSLGTPAQPPAGAGG